MTQTVAVVGAGIVGAAVASALARRGHAVHLLEQHEPAGAVSGGSLACVGAHMIDEDELPALQWSSQAWADFDDATGATMEYRRSGQIRFLLHESERVSAERWVALERRHGLPTALLDPAELRAVEPALTGPILAATWSPESAVVNPFLAVRTFANDARAHGATLRARAPVTAIDVTGERVTGVRAGGERIACDAVVLAAGPWTARLAASVDVALPIVPRKAQCLATVARPPVIRTVVGACKADGGVDAGYTQIQQSQSGQILFNTVLAGGVSAAGGPDAVPEVDRAFVRDSVDTLLLLFPALRDVELLRSWVRYEAVTPDDRFLIGRAGPEGLIVAAGDGGTGFTRAPAIGRIVADLLDGGTTPFRTDLYDPRRFAKATLA